MPGFTEIEELFYFQNKNVINLILLFFYLRLCTCTIILKHIRYSALIENCLLNLEYVKGNFKRHIYLI